MSIYESDDSGMLGLAPRSGSPLLRPPALPAAPASATAVVEAPPEPVEAAVEAAPPPPPPDDDPLPPAAELPVVDLRTFPVDRTAARLLPPEVARFYTALPYGFEAGVALIALADVSETAMLSLKLAIGREVRFARAPRIELAAAITEAYADPSRPSRPQPCSVVESTTRFRVTVRLQEGDPVDAGVYHDLEDAKSRGLEIADQIAREDGTWPFVHGRFLRPESVLSVDVHEEQPPEVRPRFAGAMTTSGG